MSWKKPEVSEIKMDAEIGSYEIDDGDRAPNEPCAELTSTRCGRRYAFHGHTVARTQIG